MSSATPRLPSSVANLLGQDLFQPRPQSHAMPDASNATNTAPSQNPKKSKKNAKSKSQNSFASFPLNPQLLGALTASKFKKPTPIQQKSIPLLLTGRDCVLMSRTGSGKTLAFVLPLLNKLKSHRKEIGVRALIISPTRELALQTFRVTKNLIHHASKGDGNDLKVSALLGGDPMDSQFSELAKNPDIIIATPGRLVHIMDLVSSFSLQKVEFLCFDEADRLFELGFKMQVEEILKQIPKTQNRQVVLVSATLPKALAEFAQAGLQEPATVRLDVEQKLPPDLKLCYLTAKSHERWAVFLHAIREIIPRDDSTLIFVATRHHAEFLHMFMTRIGLNPAMVYGKMDFEARKAELQAFENKEKNYLIVTDVAARGIDIPLLNNVINVHFPAQPKLFLHRVGRAARAGRRGVALSIVTPEELPYMLELLKFLDKPMVSLEGSIDLREDAPATLTHDENSKSVLQSKLQELFDSKNDYEGILNQFDGYFGSVPPTVLQTEMDFIVKEMSIDIGLKNQFDTGIRAYKLYKKTRAVPSNASLRRAREIFHNNADLPVHPLCTKKMGSVEKAQDFQKALDYTRSVSNYKPKATVFELVNNSKEFIMMKNLRKSKAFQNHFKSSRDKRFDASAMEEVTAPMMNGALAPKQEPKTLAEKLLARSLETHEDQPVSFATSEFQGKFRDEEFFMTYDAQEKMEIEEDDRHYQINDLTNMNQHVFGLVGEDQEDIMRDRRQLVWDKKKRKYVNMHLLAGQRLSVNNKIKNEAGVIVSRKDNDKKDNMYSKWRKKTGARIQGVGESEESFNLPTTRIMTKKARLDIANEKNQQKREKEAMLKKLDISESHHQHREAKKNELKNDDQLKKQIHEQQKRKFTEQVRSKVKVLGKRKVKEDMAREGTKKKADAIHKKQVFHSQKRQEEKIKRREKRRRLN